MTLPQQEQLVPVTQEDRDAAADLCDGWHGTTNSIDDVRSGGLDSWHVVQAFAAHRINTRPTTTGGDELAREIEAIRSGIDAFNPDARLATLSAFDAHEAVFKLVPRILTALRSDHSAEARETWETINQWCDDTFGPATPERIIERAAEEFEELGEATTNEQRAIEAADVVICLCRIPGFADALQAKMAINRKRKWRLTGEGTGYHIPDYARTALGDGQ